MMHFDSEKEFVSYIVSGLVAQGRPSFDPEPTSTCPEGQCKYRGPDGTKCAIGLIMSDEEAQACEGKTWSSAVTYGLVRSLGAGLDELASLLQDAHDEAARHTFDGRVGHKDFVGVFADMVLCSGQLRPHLDEAAFRTLMKVRDDFISNR